MIFNRYALPFFFFLYACSIGATSVLPADSLWAIVGGTLIEPDGRQVIENSVLLLEGDRIRAVGRRGEVSVPEEAGIIDASGKFLLPGLVDAHIHIFQSGGLYTRPDVIDLRKYRPYEEERQWLRDHAGDLMRRYLAAGVTTVIDVGGPMYNYVLRDSLNQKRKSPHIYLTGPLVSTYQPQAFNIEDAPIIEVADAGAARTLVQQQLPYRPDFIKIWYIARSEEMARENYEIVKATVEEAHRHDLPVAVHATQLETARLAVQAGADFLVHSVDDQVLDPSFIALLKEQEVVYCPTLVVSKNYGKTFLQKLDLDSLDFALANPEALGSLFDMRHLPEGRSRMSAMREREDQVMGRYERQDSVMAENIKKLLAAGVPVATGTDAGNIGTMHASSYFAELQAMQDAGMSLWELLEASTINGARAIGREAEFGSLRPGKRADLLILNADPLTSLNHWQQIYRVVAGGVVFDPAELYSPSPADLAQQQLNAYNARDIEAFLEPYAEDVALYNFPNEPISVGKERMRRSYSALFERAPDLHCELIDRIVMGNTVIDQERVTFQEGEPPLNAIAIYKIEEGKIAEVYFIAN